MNLATLSPDELDSADKWIYETILSHRPDALFHPMVMTDCCILYGAILRLQPKTFGRCDRIAMAFLRDALHMIAFSYVDAAANLGDVGAKHAGSLGIMGLFLKTGRLKLPLAGRKKRGQEIS